MKSKVWWSQVTRNLPPDRLIIYIWLIKFEVSLALFINKQIYKLKKVCHTRDLAWCSFNKVLNLINTLK